MLRAGFARERITPESRSLSLVGYDFRNQDGLRGNEGVLDDLYLRCLYIEDSARATGLIILSIDICVVLNDYARVLREEIALRLGLEVMNVVVHATHPHSAPVHRLKDSTDLSNVEPLATGGSVKEEHTWGDTVRELAVTAALRAQGHTVPVEVLHAEGLSALGYTRRVPDGRGGVSMCWNRQSRPDLAPTPSPDPILSLLVLRPRGGGSDFIVWSTGVHPVTLGKTSRMISADWPGAATAAISAQLGSERVMFLQGVSGEVHPQLATGDTPGDLQHLAACAAAEVNLLYRTLRRSVSPRSGADMLAVRGAVAALESTAPELTGIRLGGLAILATPFELFASVSASLRAELEYPVMPLNLTNGWLGYVPDAAAWVTGNYEVDVARSMTRVPGDTDVLVSSLKLICEALFSF
ncbi:MAG: hypothetical protein ACOC4F_01530 [bacterium]